jgi:DNA-directed RNA polymerase subunit K/omega
MSSKKVTPGQYPAHVETRSLKNLQEATGNLYNTLVVISKRANQISAELKEELHKKLEEFASTTDNLEEVFENREQIEISKYYEKLPNACILATNEFIEGDIYYRKPEEEGPSKDLTI